MVFERNIILRVTDRGKTYEFDCHVEHMLTAKKSRSWLYFCDEYGRTGTSQCFDALRFKFSGRKQHGLLSTDGLQVTAMPRRGGERVATFEVVDADGLQKKVDRAVRLLQSVGNGYDGDIEVAYSGGKDSDVCLRLAQMAGIRYRAIYKNTTIDPPGTIAHAQVGGAEIIRPKESFFELVAQMGYPNHQQRFCCRFLKEYKVLDKAVMGVRKSESTKRDKQYNEPTECRYYGPESDPASHVEAIYPILYWTDCDVINFIEQQGIRLHPHYYREDGTIDPKQRLGCMCCPLAYYKKRIKYFKAYPRMVRQYIRAGKRFRDTHPDVETITMYADVYEWFTRDVFFETQKKWDAHKNTLFGDDMDYKAFLESYFNVSLDGI